MEKLINTLNELSAELATQPETWKQMAIIKAISTIQALQQEYDELDTGHSKLFKAYCEMKHEAEQLQAQNAVMRGASKQEENK